MNRMKKVFVLVFIVFLVLEGFAQKRKESLTTPVNVNYCLPKVSYEVNVTLECIRYIPGPYQAYAEKELGITPEITRVKEKWTIRNIDVKPRYVPDEKAVYAVNATGDYQSLMLHLSAEGFLAGISAGEGGVYNETPEMKYSGDTEVEEQVIDINQLNTYNQLKEVLDTNYTYQEVDGEMKKIWDPIIRYVSKTEQDNIKEAVSEIYRIRSERVKLLAAENNVPDGKSLEIILKGFEEMEKNYMSLFLGKKEKHTVVRTFQCTPEKEGEALPVFRFTEEEGIVANKNVTAPAYLLKVEHAVVPASANVATEAGSGAAVCYRVPAVADLSLLKANQEIMSFRTIVPQLGIIKKFPLDVIGNENLFLEFYPQFGSLKKINRK